MSVYIIFSIGIVAVTALLGYNLTQYGNDLGQILLIITLILPMILTPGIGFFREKVIDEFDIEYASPAVGVPKKIWTIFTSGVWIFIYAIVYMFIE